MAVRSDQDRPIRADAISVVSVAIGIAELAVKAMSGGQDVPSPCAARRHGSPSRPASSTLKASRLRRKIDLGGHFLRTGLEVT
jgi:hypothetical protein